ncbi:DUF368 domain-containing protein [Haloprofundus salilacus]|uniref:DUF368 domain-containing protein n=1 Tax=Haloprofundus salilacus TaxID=2876190 RepID=UPI001CCF1857|nr:DUF368 domain-containing protein [Haloprofundus salilacus]
MADGETLSDVNTVSGGLRGWLGIYLRGICMGAADAVPGVSGGTIALITGIYERLIDAVTAIDADNMFRVLRGVTGDTGDAFASLREMDTAFLVTLGFGIMTAIVTITSLVEVAVETVPAPTFGFFFGLIAASALVLITEVSVDTHGRMAASIVGFALAFVVSGEAQSALGHSPAVTFVAGAIAISAMILPGISGSLLLLILGQYFYMTDTLSTFRDGVFGLLGGGSIDALAGPFVTIVTFCSGALVGLFTVAHAVDWALEHYREATFAFLIALIFGALRAPVSQLSTNLAEHGGSWTTEVLAVFAAAALVGGALVVAVDRYAGIDLD